MEESLKLLHLEDDPQMTDFVQNMLISEGLSCQIYRVETREDFISEIECGKYDIFLADYSLPAFDGFSALDIAQQKNPEVPFILFTGSLGEERAIESIRRGATDYVLKQNVNRLFPAVKRALDEKKERMEREKAERALSREKQLLDTLMDNVIDNIYFKDLNSRFIRINQAQCDFLDLESPDQAVGKTDFDFFTEIHASQSWQDEQKIIKTGNLIKKEEKVTLKNGKHNWFSVVKMPMRDEQGKIIGTFGISRNIMEQKMAEEAIRSAHKESEKLLSAISLVLIGVDQQDKITRWNSAAEQIFGIRAKEVLNHSLLHCGIKWNWKEILPRIGSHQNSAEPASWEDIRYERPDGKEGFLTITVNPLHNENKEYTGFLLIANEITKRKHLEAQLTQAQKLESIGQLAAGIAHEINTPVQYIGDNNRFLQDVFQDLAKLFAKHEKLLNDCNNGKPQTELMTEIQELNEEIDLSFLMEEIPVALRQSLEGVERVTNIVRAMKEFAHPGKQEKTMTDINRALENTITVTRNEWKYVADIESDFDDNLPMVPCLPGELNQAFLNLIVNAAQAIGEKQQNGGSEKGTITIRTRKDNNWVVISITDSGPGIPETIQNKIYDPFFTTKEVGKGTGQGLAITHNVVVEKHNGALQFESEEGEGTRFTIRLPLN